MRRFPVWIVVLCLSVAAPAVSQTPMRAIPEETVLRVVIAGGLLGQTEAFPELPASASDVQNRSLKDEGVARELYGGLNGLRKTLAGLPSDRQPDLVLLGGENLPIRIAEPVEATVAFMDRFAALVRERRTAVALGTEDIARFLRGESSANQRRPSAARELERWLAQSPIPFLASNAAIRLHHDDLNVVAFGDVELEIDKDESVGWVNELTLRRPCGVSVVFFLSVQGTPVPLKDPEQKEGKVCHTVLTLKDGAHLRPGQRYSLTVTGSGGTGTLGFSTDRALTPGRESAAQGFPIFPPAAPTHPWVIALVDPDLSAYTGSRLLTWDCGNQFGAQRGTDCELIVLPPADTVKSLLDTIHRAGEPSPFVALLSSMSDEATSEVMNASADIRLVVLDPDSGLLGLAASGADIDLEIVGADGKTKTVTQKTTRESRSTAKVDGRDASTTALLVRPEWVAETIVQTTITQTTRKNEPWRAVTVPRLETTLVQGDGMCWAPAGDHIAYTVNGTPIDRQPRYADGAFITPFAGGPQGNLWVDANDLAAAALDVMRDNAGAELAIIPETVADTDALEWLRHVRDDLNQPLNFLSRTILERVMYRADGYVRATIVGKDLVATLNKVIASDPDKFCLAGFEQTGCGATKIDDKHLRVNGRQIDETHYYSVAMFRSLADRNELEYGHDSHDLVADLDARFRQSPPSTLSASACVADLLTLTPAPQKNPAVALADRLELRRQRPLGYVRLDPMSLQFTQNRTTMPDNANKTLLTNAVEGASPKDYTEWAVSMKGDLALVDTPRWAVRGVGAFDFQRKEIDDEVSIDKDEFTLGVRGDRKIIVGDATARIYAGYFWEGGLKTRKETVASSRTLEKVTDPVDASKVIQETIFHGPDLAYFTKPRRFFYPGVGIEVMNFSLLPKAKITEMGVEWAFKGSSKNELDSVRINSDELSVPAFVKDGVEEVVKAYFTDTVMRNPETSDVLTLHYSPLDQRRLQITFNTEHKLFKAAGGDAKVTNELRWRFYRQAEHAVKAYSLQSSVRDSLALTVPFWGRMSVVLKGEYNHVNLDALEDPFKVTRITVGLELPVFGKASAGGLYFR